ncbi:MAG: hypothetical protein PHF84_10165, partial [bacterium]|nr:hypothetical protein [bacterium]
FDQDWSTSLNPKSSAGLTEADAFLTKVSNNGNYCRTHIIGAGFEDMGFHAAPDYAGNMFITGYINQMAGSNIALGNDWSEPLPSTCFGNSDIFLAKILNTDFPQWSAVIGGPGNDAAFYVNADNQNNIYITGQFESNVNFGSPLGSSDTKTSAGSRDAFITMVDSSGTYGWTRTFGSTGEDIGWTVAVTKKSNVYVGGQFEGTVNFQQAWTNTDIRSSLGAHDMFITKLSPFGDYINTWTYPGWEEDGLWGLTTDNSNNIYAVGYTMLSGVRNAFICKLDKDLSFCPGWPKILYGTSDSEAYAITVATNTGEIFVTGYYTDALDFGGMWGVYDYKYSNGGKDIFVMKINADGTYGWTKTMGGTYDDEANGVAVIPQSKPTNIFVAGSFRDGFYFDRDWGTTNDIKYSADLEDVFLTKFNNMPSMPNQFLGYYTADNKVILFWQDTPDEQGYKIYRQDLLSMDHPTNVGFMPSNSYSFTDHTVVPDSYYEYMIISTNYDWLTGSPKSVCYVYPAAMPMSFMFSNSYVWGGIWNLIGISKPLQSREISANLNSGETGDYYLYEWNPSLTPDANGMQYQQPSKFQPYTGYWIYPGNSFLFNPQGEPLSKSDNAGLPLSPGWNLITSPFLFPCDVLRVGERGNTNLLTPFLEAEQYIDPGLYFYDGYSYFLTDVLYPWYGCWIWANQECMLYVKGSEQTLKSRSKIPAAKSVNLKDKKYDWLSRIGFSAGRKQDNFNFIGTAQKSADAGDQYDYNKVPKTPGANVRLSIGNSLSYDIRSPITTYKVWEFKASSEIPFQDGELTWDLNQIGQAGLMCALVERYTGKVISRSGSGSIKVEGGKYGINKEYLLKVATPEYAAFLTGEVDIIDVKTYPNPYIKSKHSFLKTEYTLTEESRIEFSLYTIAGEKVFSLKEDQTPGFKKQISLAIDKLSSGSYVYVIKARSKLSEKEIVKKGKLVVIK